MEGDKVEENWWNRGKISRRDQSEMIRSVQGKQSRLLPVTLRNDYMVMARSPSPHPPKIHLLTLSKDQKSVKEVSFNRLHFPNVIKSTFTIIIRNLERIETEIYVHIYIEREREITNRINSRDILRAFNLNLNNYLIRINTNMNTTRIKFTTTFVKKQS